MTADTSNARWRVQVSDLTQIERATVLERIASKCAFDRASGCVIHRGKAKPVTWFGGRPYRTSRLVLMLVLGREIPSTLDVAHSCDRPHCCAPWHLRTATRAENMADAIQRGRLRRGEQHPAARLTEADVRAARRERRAGTASIGQMAARYGVSPRTIRDAVRGKTWRHVDNDNVVQFPPPRPRRAAA